MKSSVYLKLWYEIQANCETKNTKNRGKLRCNYEIAVRNQKDEKFGKTQVQL
jgi:hypothetical protein